MPTRTLAALLLALLLASCKAGGFIQAPDPRRPQPRPADAVSDTSTDCAPMDPSKGAPSKPFRDRIIDMAANLADEGLRLLSAAAAAKPGEPPGKLAAAVSKFLEALALDPYNVKATYNLAAAYARAGRKQCSLNLLARLAEMASFPSQREAIDESVDRLMGRGKVWKGKPDPDFDDLRSDARFVQLLGQLQ